MFQCYVHNWSSHAQMCPICFSSNLTTGAGSDSVFVSSNWETTVTDKDAQIKKLEADLENLETQSGRNYSRAKIAEKENDKLILRIAELEAEVEQMRVQLAGVSVATLQNTENSKKDRAVKGQYGWSPAYQDVCNAIDREIELRELCRNMRNTIAAGNFNELLKPDSEIMKKADAILGDE